MLAAKFCNYRGKPRWRVSVFIKGRRKQRYFKTLAQANQWIQELTSTGCVASFWAALSSQEQLDLVGAYRIAQQRSICLLEAALNYSALSQQNALTLAEAASRYIRVRSEQNLRPLTLRQIRWKLKLLAEAFGELPCHELTTAMLEGWFASRDWKRSTIEGVIAKLGPFFNWCIRESYCIHNPLKSIIIPKEDDIKPSIFSPDQVACLMAAATSRDPGMIPYLALGLFAGVRPLEIERLTWDNVLDEYIEITAAKAKTRQRRLVSLSDNLKEWLSLGGDLPLMNKRKRLARLLKIAQLTWQPDVMRHSFASYHLAFHQSVDKTAFELGHRDSKMLFAHYRELVTKKAAQSYWDIRP